MNNAHYWLDRKNLAKKAENHMKEMEEGFLTDIEDSVTNSIIFDYLATPELNQTIIPRVSYPYIEFWDLKSDEALWKAYEKGYIEKDHTTTCILNFASYKNPGGKFIDGSSAQEESLCHVSTLYNVLSRKSEYYKGNKISGYNNHLYTDRALYSPNIIFIKDNQTINCDVLTCAAPNKNAAQKYKNISDMECLAALSFRIDFILNVARLNNVDTLILGAYGCGVFGNMPDDVATVFYYLLDKKYKECFRRIIFAIPKMHPNDTTMDVFKKYYG